MWSTPKRNTHIKRVRSDARARERISESYIFVAGAVVARILGDHGVVTVLGVLCTFPSDINYVGTDAFDVVI